MTAPVGAAQLAQAQVVGRPLDARGAMMLSGAIVPTLLRLSAPNLIALCSATIVSIAETAYVGSLGVASLGGVP